MQFGELVDLANVVQAAVEQHYGLYGKLRVKPLPNGDEEGLEQWASISDNCLPVFCAMYKEMGVGLFGASIVLYSPTGKAVGLVHTFWRFVVDDAGFRPAKGTREDHFWSEDYWMPWEGGPVIRPDTNISKVEVGVRVETGCRVQEDETDLRVGVREQLKDFSKAVTFTMTPSPAFQGKHSRLGVKGVSAGHPWW